MVRWAMEDGPVGGARGCQRKGTKPAGALGIPGSGLVEVEFGLGRAASGGRAGRPMRQVEMEEDVLHGGGEGDEGADPHLAAAGRAQEREDLVDASQELGPEHATGS